MKSSDSEPAEESPPFVEDDSRETRLPYGTGGTPLLVVIAWVAIHVVYLVVMWRYALPDLRRWLAH